MKRLLPIMLLCVIFVLSCNIQNVFAFSEDIQFNYNGRVFSYYLEPNIKSSNLFDLDFEINKYNRFGSVNQRKELLRKMLSVGIDKRIAVNYLFPNFDKFLSKMQNSINTKPKDASLKVNTNSEKVFSVINEQNGVAVDCLKVYDLVCCYYINNKNLNFDVPTTILKPNVVYADFKDYINLRSDFSTSISSSSLDRKHNIKNALQAINNVEILPNQVFSFNNIVGRRSEQNGYRNAKIIVNNEFVEGVGGGVCQVSSTLYNAALLAGLEIVEANKHSVQVGYVKSGFDAMVNYGSSDLKFKNNSNEKITIITNFNNQNIRIRLFGESLKSTIFKLRNEIYNIEQPEDEIMVDNTGEYVDKVVFEDEFFQLKKPVKGMEIKTYREKYVSGVLVNTELLRHDKYKKQNSIKVYGVVPRIKEKKEADNAASFYGFSLIG